MAYIPEEQNITTFDEQVVGQRVPILDYVPTWGVSIVNYDVTEISGAAATSSVSEIRLETGTDPNGEAEIETKLIGQYKSGAEVSVGWGVRIPNLPTGTQSAEWSYSRNTEESGFGWGIDSNSLYLFYINDNVKQIVSQSAWNVNTLDDFDFDVNNGNIYQTEFVWYGYGNIKFYILTRNEENTQLNRTLVHSVGVSGSTSISNPNQPIRFDVKNGGSTSSNFDLFVGGHQFNLIGGGRGIRKRTISEEVETITLENTGSYQPLFSVRRKERLRNKDNSVNVVVKGFRVRSSANMTFQLAAAPTDTITDGTWVDTQWGDESAVEVKKSTTGNILTSSGSVRPSIHLFTTTGFFTAGTELAEGREIVLGRDTEAIVYGKLSSPSTGETVDLTVNWEEEW